jgi:hypothetical protein
MLLCAHIIVTSRPVQIVQRPTFHLHGMLRKSVIISETMTVQSPETLGLPTDSWHRNQEYHNVNPWRLSQSVQCSEFVNNFGS